MIRVICSGTTHSLELFKRDILGFGVLPPLLFLFLGAMRTEKQVLSSERNLKLGFEQKS